MNGPARPMTTTFKDTGREKKDPPVPPPNVTVVLPPEASKHGSSWRNDMAVLVLAGKRQWVALHANHREPVRACLPTTQPFASHSRCSRLPFWRHQNHCGQCNSLLRWTGHLVPWRTLQAGWLFDTTSVCNCESLLCSLNHFESRFKADTTIGCTLLSRCTQVPFWLLVAVDVCYSHLRPRAPTRLP
eukprot:351074-Chlamydomonas_euryale.AAC.2